MKASSPMPPTIRLAALGLLMLAAACGRREGRAYDIADAAHRREAREQRIATVLAEAVRGCAKPPAPVAVVHAGPDANFGEEHARVLARLSAALEKDGYRLLPWALPTQAGGAPDEGYLMPPVDLSADWLAARLGTVQGVGAVVSLYDAPVGGVARWPAGMPPLVCWAPLDGSRVPELMKAGKIPLAILPRRGPVAAGERDWFEIHFTVVRPDTVQAWGGNTP